MIENTIVEGKPAMVAYLKQDFTPATAEDADLVKILFEDGRVRVAYRVDESKNLHQKEKDYTDSDTQKDSDGNLGVWRTIRGRRVFIREGETPTQAVKRSIAERSAKAKQYHNPATKEKQQRAAKFEKTVAKAINGKDLGNHEPFDVIKDNHAVEVKAIIGGKHPKITMHPESLSRKNKFLLQNKMKGHTVVIDARTDSPQYYYWEGVGSFRLSTMKAVTSNELRKLFT